MPAMPVMFCVMNTMTVHEWSYDWQRLGAELPELADTDLVFVQDYIMGLVGHLMMRTDRNREEIETAMRRSGLHFAMPSPVKAGAENFAGEGAALQKFPVDDGDDSGIPKETSESGYIGVSI